MCILPNLHKERQGEGHWDEEVFRGDVACLENVMAKDTMSVSVGLQEIGRVEEGRTRQDRKSVV